MKEIWLKFRSGGVLVRLIAVNAAVFLALGMVKLMLFLFQSSLFDFTRFLAVPASWNELLHQPWSLISYMFLHENPWHLLSNMIMLYFGGVLFTEFLGKRKLFPVYLIGGIAGALLYMIAFNTLPAFENILPHSKALGASASVLAIFFTIAFYLPNYEVGLLFLGSIRLKYLAWILLVIDLLSIDKGNPGGHIAHLGGALFGFIYVVSLRKGHDFIASMINTYDRVFAGINRNRKKTQSGKYNVNKQIRVEYSVNGMKSARENSPGINRFENKSKQEIIDEILDKINKSGYESLTREEKETIFKISKED